LAVVAELDKARIFNAVGLGFGDWKDDALGKFLFGIES
jgi:hypothetical protein